MKKLFKAVACVAVGCSLLSISAFAALTGSVTAQGDGTYGVRVSNLGDGESIESTILVYKSATEINALPASIDASDIVYINQQTASGGNASYTVNVGSRAQAGDKIYFFAGGTNDSAAVLLGSETIPVAVTGVTLNKNATSITAGQTETLTATVAPNDATDKSVTWTSSNEAVATVSNEGVVTAVAAGEATITVTSNADNTKTATCTVTVTVPVTGVTLDQSELALTVGDAAVSLTATVAPNDATDKTVTWSSSNEAVATVSNEGVVTAVAAGEATITVTSNADNTKTATCTVTVTPATVAVTGVTLNKSETTITAGQTETLTATVAPADATDKTVTWSSSNTAVATVADGVVTAVAAGEATITVTSNADNTKTATCTVTVNAAAPSYTLGDVNNDGSITSYDASLVIQHFLNIAILEGDAFAAADVNGDGSVTSYDASLIIQDFLNIAKINAD